MQLDSRTASITKKQLWSGRIISGLFVVFLVADGVSHVMKPAGVVEAFSQLGIPLRLAVGLGILQLACIALYVLPRTSILGAILLTGFLGGAIAIHVRVGDPFFPVFFLVIVGAALWLGLFLRDERLRVLTLPRGQA